MTIRIVGAALLILGCGSVGFQMAAAHVREERILRQLLRLLDYMECELQYHLTPLPELCRQAAEQEAGVLKGVFLRLAEELDNQMSPDVGRCMGYVLGRQQNLPPKTKKLLRLMGNSLGKFDLQGQIKGLESLRGECRRELKALEAGRASRLREYKTLGLCAGAALAILFI